MDFIQIEELLVREQLRVTRTIQNRNFLQRADSVIESLSSQLSEQVMCELKSGESLSASEDVTVPFKITGKMLGIGRHKERYYTEDELIKSVRMNNGNKFPLKVDHRNDEVASIVGAVDRIFWDSTDKCIRYEAHVNDITHARNINDGVITDVSVTVLSAKMVDAIHGVVGKDLEYDELSLVVDGAYKGNTLEVAGNAVR